MKGLPRLTRPAWIEADLQRVFTEDRYAEIAALWLGFLETRFGHDGPSVAECALGLVDGPQRLITLD